MAIYFKNVLIFLAGKSLLFKNRRLKKLKGAL